jgi:glycerol uptake operon antiterminator
MPGVIPHMIEEAHARTNIPVFVGGLIRTVADVERALEAGAAAVTTSKAELWRHFAGAKR